MSIAPVVEAMKDFLTSDKAETLCIRGKWGVGKTHLWQATYNDAVAQGQVALGRYAYVSLFGLRSLNEVTAAIFQETKSTVSKGAKANNRRWRAPWEPDIDAKRREGYFAVDTAKTVFRASQALVDRIVLSGIHEQIVCIDDVERKGSGLTIDDVLGLASFLRLEKGCKVVVLMNSDQLGGEQEAFVKRSEKALDRSLELKPTLSEAAAIGIRSDHPFREELRCRVEEIGVGNVRLIHRMLDFADRAAEIVPSAPPALAAEIRATIVLFVACVFDPDTFPPPSILRSFERSSYYARLAASGSLQGAADQVEAAKKEIAWGDALSDWNYVRLTPLNAILLDGVEQGFFNAAELRTAVEQRVAAPASPAPLEQFWEDYQGRIIESEEAEIAKLLGIVRSNLSTIPPRQMNEVALFLKRYAEPGILDQIVGEYVAAHERDLAFMDDDDWRSIHSVEATFKIAIEDAIKNYADERNPKDVLASVLSSGRSYAQDLRLLSRQPAKFYEDAIRAASGRQLDRILYTLRDVNQRYGGRGLSGLSSLEQAIENLARTNKMNAAKLNEFRSVENQNPVDEAG